MTQENTQDLKQSGYTVLSSVVDTEWVDVLSEAIDRLLPVYQKPQGVMLHAPCYHNVFIMVVEKI